MSDKHSSGVEEGESLKSKLREEMRKYLIASGYLFVCFCALLFYRAALLEHDGVHYVLLSVAAVGSFPLGQ